MDRSEFRRLMKRLWRKNDLKFKGARPGVSIQGLVGYSDRRNRRKKLAQFDLWNEVFDEYVSWTLSIATVLFTELKRCKSKRGRRYQFYRALVVLSCRILADLLAIRFLCRAGFDVAAKALSRTTIEYIDVFALIIVRPDLAAEFNKSDDNEISNAFWHKHVARGKIRKLLLPRWTHIFGKDAEGWDRWLYDYHSVLGMAAHPSFSGSVFSVLALGSGSRDKWLGFMGDRAEISTDTFYRLSLHIWKLLFLFSDFPFSKELGKLAVRYNARSELHRHARRGGRVLFGLMVIIWSPKLSSQFFKDPDISNIWPSVRRKK